MKASTSGFSKEQEEIGFLKIMQVTTNKITDVVKEYNDIILVRRMENGRKAVDQRYDQIVGTIKNYKKIYILENIEMRRKKLEATYSILKQTLDNTCRQAFLSLENVLERSKKLARVDVINHKINGNIKKVPVWVHLPSKEEVASLTQRIERLNQKLDVFAGPQ